MKLIDILTSLEDNDFIEIKEVTEGYSIDCYVKDSLKYLNKFKKAINAEMTVIDYQYVKELNIHRVLCE